MVYTCYDKVYTVLGIGRAPPGLPGPRAPPAWYQALPEQAQKACLLGALSLVWDQNYTIDICWIMFELTFRASLLEKLLSQCLHGKDLTARCILLCLLRSWLRLKD
jgi:hypothetical protein